MRSTNASDYVPTLKNGARVRLSIKDHRESGQFGVVVGVLPNPSKCREHQWYDVRFDDYTYGRFLEGRLECIYETEAA